MCSLQYEAVVAENIAKLTGSPCRVTVSRIMGGSVVVTQSAAFLDNNAESAKRLADTLKSNDPSSVFGSSYGPVTVDLSSVVTETVVNPSSKFVISLAVYTVPDITGMVGSSFAALMQCWLFMQSLVEPGLGFLWPLLHACWS